MARKTKIVVIDAEGRDKGKMFQLTEKDAYSAEKWALRLIEAGVKSGVDIPSNLLGRGMAAIQALGITVFASISSHDREPLLDELFACIKIIRDSKHPDVAMPLLQSMDDIEEIATLGLLQYEVIALHGNFSMGESPLNATSETSTQTQSTSTNIKTSQPQSPRPSPRKALRL